MNKVDVTQGDPRDPAATALLQSSHALMQELFAAEDNHYLEISDLCAPNIRFFIARAHDQTMGCVALANQGAYGEVKSLFVSPTARGLGVGKALMQALEAEAKQQALPVLNLETGDTLTAAQRLYERHGFHYCGAFGSYPESAASVFMTKTL
ncbi:GNAT family N-acetyltransferase [Cognatishimia sp. WU-CL00825]|uniref:GNAT family N-acetyltransferase n=1 Tax=Cognatishimia sp. WU-CL00825 TaxID=3127658 RepID=UPI003109F876